MSTFWSCEHARVHKVVSQISFPGYKFTLVEVLGDTLLRVVYDEPDVMTGVNERQEGRPWLIPNGWSPIQIAQTCLKAVLTSLEHRAREHFTYNGRAVFNPHYDLDTLWNVAQPREHETLPIPFKE